MHDYLDEYIVATRLLFRQQGVTISDLSKALEKTERSVYTILNQLDSMYFIVNSKPDPENPKRKVYWADRKLVEYIPNLQFTQEDKAVYNYLIDMANTAPGMQVQARRLFSKLRLIASEGGALIENGNRKSNAIINSFANSKSIDTKKSSKAVSAILDAISTKRWMKIKYMKFPDKTTYDYDVYPIIMFADKGDYYVYVFNCNHELKMLALERFEEVIKIYEDEIPEQQIDIKALINDPFGFIYDSDPFEVRLWIEPWQAEYEKAKIWPDCVSFEDVEDGTVMTATTHSCFDLERWILARSSQAKVLSPDWLRDSIASSLSEALKQYEQ